MREYISTRGGKERISSAAAIIKGLAGNKGLYVPTEIPKLPFTIEEMFGRSYQEIAFNVMREFFDDFTGEELKYCINGAYDEKFEEKDIAKLVQAGTAHFLELFHGRTAAFKDMALSILPYLMTTAMKKEGINKKVCILAATSGDTGKAALEGFSDVEGTEVVVFYPHKAVSVVQEKQMTTQEGRNTHVYAIKGNFDDAQRGVKAIFSNNKIAAQLGEKGVLLSSANSINIGRLIPQVAYYVYAYIKLAESKAIKVGQPMNVVVPTGNFGNILASYYAQEMGIPIKMFICASNKNKILTDFLSTGVYDIHRDFYVTNSPSMDILVSSNLERLLFHLHQKALGSNEEAAEAVSGLMDKLDREGRYELSAQVKKEMAKFYGDFSDVDETLACLRSVYNKHGYLMDTHTAVAYDVFTKYKRYCCDESQTVIAATASPYKFPASVARAIGIPEMEDEFDYIDAISEKTGVPVPKGLQGLKDKPVLHDEVIEASDMADAVLNAVT